MYQQNQGLIIIISSVVIGALGLGVTQTTEIWHLTFQLQEWALLKSSPVISQPGTGEWAPVAISSQRDQSSRCMYFFFLNETKALKSLGVCKIFCLVPPEFQFQRHMEQLYACKDNPELLHLVLRGILIPNPPLFHNKKRNLPTRKKIS